jgi:hypothetical protein
MPIFQGKRIQFEKDSSDEDNTISDQKVKQKKGLSSALTASEEKDTFLCLLPIDILRIITSYFSKKDFTNCYCVSKCWNRTLRNSILTVKILSKFRRGSSNCEIDYLSRFPNLQELNLTNCEDNLKEEDFETISRILTLRKLQIFWNSKLERKSLSLLTNLERLSLRIPSSTRLYLFESCLKNIPRLSSLRLTNDSPSTPTKKFNFCSVPNLLDLELYGFSYISSINS